MKLFKSRQKPMTAQKLSHLTRGMQHAATVANSMIGQQYLYLLDQFFERDHDDPDSPMTARMVELILDSKHSVQVPLISLLSPRGLALEEMKVKMSVCMESGELKSANHELGQEDAKRHSFSVSLQGKPGKRAKEMDIEMRFKAIDAPESLSRILDEYTNLINPTRMEDDDQKPDDQPPTNNGKDDDNPEEQSDETISKENSTGDTEGSQSKTEQNDGTSDSELDAIDDVKNALDDKDDMNKK